MPSRELSDFVSQGNMSLKEIAEYVGLPEEEVLSYQASAIGGVEKMWRCGESGRIRESEYECSCDSVFCSLGEWVKVSPWEDTDE